MSTNRRKVMNGRPSTTPQDLPRPREVTILRVLSPTFVSIILALGLMVIGRRFFPEEILRARIETWGIFFAVFGVIYAIIVGFLLIEVLRRYHSMKSTMEQELNAVEDVRDFLVYLDENEEAARNIHESLLDYVNSVVSREWAEMAEASKWPDSDTSPELYRVMEGIHKIKVTNASDGIALSCLIPESVKYTNSV